MNSKIIATILIASVFGLSTTSNKYYGSTTAPVVLAGAIIKAKHTTENSKKYKRKDCPVCKGKGWYMSGDGILKIDCTYCEPEKTSGDIAEKNESPQPITKTPHIIRR